MSSRTALAPGNDRNSDTVSGARPLGAPRPGRAGEPLALRRPSLRGSPPDFPGPARLAASRPPPDLQACRPSPTPQPIPSPGGAPSSGPLSRPSADRFRLGLVPPGSPLPCLPGAPPSGVFSGPFPFRPPAADPLSPSRICRASDPKAQSWSSRRKAWPSPASGAGLPCRVWVLGFPGAPLLSFPALRPSRSLLAPAGTRSQEAVFHLSWAQGLF